MTGVELLVGCLVVAYFVKILPGAIADTFTAMRGKQPRHPRPGGFTGWVGDVWDDAWEDARARRRARREARDPTTPRSGLRRWAGLQWEAAWEKAEQRHLATREARRATSRATHRPQASSPDTPTDPVPDPEPEGDGPIRISGQCQWCGKPTTTRIGDTGVWGHVDPQTGQPACVPTWPTAGRQGGAVGDANLAVPAGLDRPCRTDCGGTQAPVDGTVIDAGDGHQQALSECDNPDCRARDRVWWWRANPGGDHGWIPILPVDHDHDLDDAWHVPFMSSSTVVHDDGTYDLSGPRQARCPRCENTLQWRDMSPTGATCICGGFLAFNVGEVWFPTARGRLVLGVGDNPMVCQCGSHGPWLNFDANRTDVMAATCADCREQVLFPYDAPGAGSGGQGSDTDPATTGQDAAGSVSDLYAERDGVPLDVQLLQPVPTGGTPNEYQEVPSMAEVTGLTSAIGFAEGMRKAYEAAASDVETFVASLNSHGVSGDAIAASLQAAEAQQTAATAWARAAAALQAQTNVAEAYAATPGAGSREFVTGE